jgi:hypothetical protein
MSGANLSAPQAEHGLMGAAPVIGNLMSGWCLGFEPRTSLDHTDAVRLDAGGILDLDDLHGGGTQEQFHHDALTRWVQVLDNDKGHIALLRHIPQEQF